MSLQHWSRTVVKNCTWLDCKARQWLKQQKQDIVPVNVDKGLGDAKHWVTHTSYWRL